MNAETLRTLNSVPPPGTLKAAQAEVSRLEKLLGLPASAPFTSSMAAKQRILELNARIDVLNAMGKPPVAPAPAERPKLEHLHGRERFLAATAADMATRPAVTTARPDLKGRERFVAACAVETKPAQGIVPAAETEGKPELTGRARFAAAVNADMTRWRAGK